MSALQHEREFTFPDLQRLTPDLSGAERLAVWLGLPVDLRGEAWRELAERIERQSRARFAEERLGGWATPQEIADEIALIWGECVKVPLGGVGVEEAERSPRSSKRRGGRPPDEPSGDLDVLRSIPSAEYVPLLTGREVNRVGYVQCPLHEERTPSLHVSTDDGRWHCFGCQRGGDLFDFYAELNGMSVPTGAGFVEFIREVATAVAASGAWR